MKRTYWFIITIAALSIPFLLSAQDESEPEATNYRIEAFGSVATGDKTPFWMVSNRYGVVPLDAGNGYLRAGSFHNQTFGKGFYWNAGLDVVAAVPRYHNVFIQQLYAEIGYKSVRISIGSKENYSSLWDRNLSSGDLVQSTNARPIPEINFSMPHFTIVPGTKGWLQVKGNFAIGRSFDKGYLESFVKEKQTYVNDVLWHHKSAVIQVKDTHGNFPLAFILGVRHVAQWGGTSSNPKIGIQPHSLKDFIRVVCGNEGGGDATLSDQINVLGNHYGSYDFKLSYEQPKWALQAYYQHFFDDKSGMIFANKLDGLWGLQLDLKTFSWLNKVVVEHLNTLNQSGPLHFIEFDHEAHPGRGGGADNYYNNGEYLTGSSYFNRSIGSPLITSPEYNADRRLGFQSNRVRVWHLGAEGALSAQVSYRVLLSVMNSWGTSYTPFRNRKDGVSGLVDIRYQHPQLKGWVFTGSLAADAQSLYGNNVGFSLGIVKRGLLRKW